MAFVIKIIPLILIKFFAIIMISAKVLEEIQIIVLKKIIISVSEKINSGIVILVRVFGIKFMTGKIISRAFYLIEKIKKKLIYARGTLHSVGFSLGEGEKK